MVAMDFTMKLLFLELLSAVTFSAALVPLPSFVKMKENYPGYEHFGGHYHNNRIINIIGCKRDLLLHDTSALRLSFAFNKVGGLHSLGKELIHLSRTGIDSVTGKKGQQFIYHPIAYGPFLADKYGYPTITKLHQLDPINTKKNFWGKQGILRIITYRKIKNLPVGHVALWDCDHFHESKDWISGHSLITVEFWESPDSNCSSSASNRNKNEVVKPTKPLVTDKSPSPSTMPLQSDISVPSKLHHVQPTSGHQSSTNNLSLTKGIRISAQNPNLKLLLKNKSFRKKFFKKYYVSNGHLRHAHHRGLSP